MRSNVSLRWSYRCFNNARLNIRGLNFCGLNPRKLIFRGNFTNLHSHSGHHPERRFCGELRWPLLADRHMYKRAVCRGNLGWWNHIKISVVGLRQRQPRMLSLQCGSAWPPELLPGRLLHHVWCMLSNVHTHPVCSLHCTVANLDVRGWSVYPSNLYGTQTPCYSIPAVPLVAPTGLKARAARIWPRAAATSLITTQLFTLRYPLVHYDKSLSASEKAGIAIGIVGGVTLFAAMLFNFIRRYRAIRRKQLDDRSTIFSGPRSFGPTDLYDRRVSTFSSAPGGYYAQSEPPMAELPPPHAPRPPLNEEQLWFPSNAPQSSGQQPTVEEHSTQTISNELEGDEHLHAHHPAFGSPVEEIKLAENQDGRVSPI